MYYQFFMYPFNEVPPAAVGGDFAFADAEIQIHAVRDRNTHALTEAWVNFHIEYFFDLPQNLIGMHIHKGRFFEAGPIVISSRMTRVDDARIGELWFQVEVTDPDELDAIEGILGILRLSTSIFIPPNSRVEFSEATSKPRKLAIYATFTATTISMNSGYALDSRDPNI